MKSLFVGFYLLIFLPFYSVSQSCTTSAVQWFGGVVNCPDDPYRLVFHDEFEENNFDTNKWYTYYPYGVNNSDQCEFCRTHGDNEAQIYQDDNISLENGILRLTAVKENAIWYTATREHTSGMIHSKQQFFYGKFEIKCKIPSGNGFWPAFWLWGLDECDVFEICGHDVEEFNTNLHMDCDDEHYQTPQTHAAPDLSQNFHIFSVEWEPLYVDWRIDGQLVRRVHRLSTITGELIECNDDVAVNTLIWNEMIPNQPMSVIANLALSPSGSYCGNDGLDNTTPFPSTFEIDYIRVYQKTPQEGLIDLCNQSNISGADEICSANSETYTFSGPNSVNEWQMSSNLIMLDNDSTSVTVIPNPLAEGAAWVKAIFDPYQPCPQTSLTKNLWLGKPTISDIIGPRFGCTVGELNGIVDAVNYQNIQYQWQVSGASIISGQNTSTILVDPIDGPFGFTAKLKAKNICGWSDWYSEFFPTECDGEEINITMQLVVFPNPAQDYVSVNLEENKIIEKAYLFENHTEIVETIEIWNNETKTFSLENKENGLYYLLILTNNGEWFTTNSFVINKE